jgi:hypothetical protein
VKVSLHRARQLLIKPTEREALAEFRTQFYSS